MRLFKHHAHALQYIFCSERTVPRGLKHAPKPNSMKSVPPLATHASTARINNHARPRTKSLVCLRVIRVLRV